MLSGDPRALPTIIIGIEIVIMMYWTQNKRQFGHLDRTDGRHPALAIIQLSICCFYFTRLPLAQISMLPSIGESSRASRRSSQAHMHTQAGAVQSAMIDYFK